MREKIKSLIGVVVIMHVMAFIAMGLVYDAGASGLYKQAGDIEITQEIAPPFDGVLKYPFTKRDSLRCGHWRAGSQDYPYFGAPRGRNTRSQQGLIFIP